MSGEDAAGLVVAILVLAYLVVLLVREGASS